MIKRTAKSKKPRRKAVRKVWHIFRFEERFELSEDARVCRKGPLMYTREVVGSGSNDESTNYFRQLSFLRASTNRLKLRWMWDELKEIAANRSRCYRGYILDEKFAPASDKRISQWMEFELAETRKLLLELASIGLIEKVDIPQWDFSKNEPPDNSDKDGAKDKGTKKQNRSKDTNGGKKQATSCAHGRAQARTDTFTREIEYRKIESKVGNKEIKEKNKSKVEKEEKTESTKSTPGQAKSKTKADIAQNQGQKQKISSESEGKETTNAGPRLYQDGNQEDKTTAPPTTTPPNPNYPTKSEAGAVRQCHRGVNSIPPPGSVNGPCTAITDRLDRLYDPAAKVFAEQIFKALQVRHSVDSPEGRSELGNYAAAWTDAQAACLPPSVLSRLWDKSVKEAWAIGRKRRRIKFTNSAEAVWRWIFNQRLAEAKTSATAV